MALVLTCAGLATASLGAFIAWGLGVGLLVTGVLLLVIAVLTGMG